MEQEEQHNFTGYNTNHKKTARILRKEMTRQERHLWFDFLRSYPHKIYRQRPIEQFIVDFYCSKARLIIELDGSQHYTQDGMLYDVVRTEVLEKYKLKVIRFSNNDVDYNFLGVCTAIDEEIKERLRTMGVS